MMLLRLALMFFAFSTLGSNCERKSGNGSEKNPPGDSASTGKIRIATFNASLYRAEAGALRAEMATRTSAQAKAVAEIIRELRPQILLLNEFDHDPTGASYKDFVENYLLDPELQGLPLPYAHHYAPPVNTGVPSGFDLDNDGQVNNGGGDALGFGAFPGQYGFVIFSQFPIDLPQVRTFQKFLWKDLPGALLPGLPPQHQNKDWYDESELEIFRLSSKSHVSVPIALPGFKIHLLASHPTPPAFDGPEERNKRRNHDEVRLWTEFVSVDKPADFLKDDAGTSGGLGQKPFVVLGDLNLDPQDGSGFNAAIQQLLEHPRTQNLTPTSQGGKTSAALRGGINSSQKGDPSADTAQFPADVVGNLRVDYVIPSVELEVLGSGVFWPKGTEPTAQVFESKQGEVFDHRPVFVDISLKLKAPFDRNRGIVE